MALARKALGVKHSVYLIKNTPDCINNFAKIYQIYCVIDVPFYNLRERSLSATML